MHLSSLYRSISFLCLAVGILLLPACGSKQQYAFPHIEIETKFGTIEAELYPEKAPKSVAAFLSNVEAGLYDNTSFYRVLNTDNQSSGSGGTALVQGGVWQTQDQRAASLPAVPHEGTRQTGLHHEDGTLSFARQDTGTAKTEFFICIGNQPGFDQGGGNNADGLGYAAFGKVVQGMNIVRQIHRRPFNGEQFTPKVDIIRIRRL